MIEAFRLFHKDHRGVAAVEFALVLVPFLLVLIEIVDFGLGIWTYNNMSEAVRAGARFAIVRGDGVAAGFQEAGPGAEGTSGSPIPCTAPIPASARVVPVVCTYAIPLDPSKLTVWVEWSGGNIRGDTVTVNARYEFTPLLAGALNMPNITINLRSQTKMEIACCSG